MKRDKVFKGKSCSQMASSKSSGKKHTTIPFRNLPHSTSVMPSSLPSYKLVTVNKAPERAKRLIGQMSEALKDRYTIIHSANCETIDQVSPTVQQIEPQLLVRATADKIWANKSPFISNNHHHCCAEITDHASTNDII